MGAKRRRPRRYELFGRTVNTPEAIARVKDGLAAPESCRFCGGDVALVNNSSFYNGREYGWPLAYCCGKCGARVGCHPGTDIPLGTLADTDTMKARRAAHAEFDRLWAGKTAWHRKQAYQALSRALGVRSAHISWLDAAQCKRVVSLCRNGALTV